MTIKEQQWALRFWYHAYKGKINGKKSKELTNAIKMFQKDKGLKQTGNWGKNTDTKMKAWISTISHWLRKNGYSPKDKFISSCPTLHFRLAFYRWNTAHKYDKHSYMNSVKLKQFQQEDLPNLQDFRVYAMDEHRIRAEWTRPIKYDKVLIYETNAKGTKYNDAVGSSKGWRYTFEGLKPSTRKYIRVRGVKTVNGCKCFTNYTRVDYGQTSNNELAKLRKEIHEWSDPYDKYPGWCETWCSIAYRNAGLNYHGACCANNHKDNYANKGTNVPNGALVFSGDNYKNVICDVCGRHCGHIGIYLDGKVYSAQRPYGQDFFNWKATFGYGGYSKDGNDL